MSVVPFCFIKESPMQNLHMLKRTMDNGCGIPVYNTCTLLYNNVKYVDANLDAPDNAISDNESSSEMLTSQSQISE